MDPDAPVQRLIYWFGPQPAPLVAGQLRGEKLRLVHPWSKLLSPAAFHHRRRLRQVKESGCTVLLDVKEGALGRYPLWVAGSPALIRWAGRLTRARGTAG